MLIDKGIIAYTLTSTIILLYSRLSLIKRYIRVALAVCTKNRNQIILNKGVLPNQGIFYNTFAHRSLIELRESFCVYKINLS